MTKNDWKLKKRSFRHLSRFGVRTLLLLVTVIAILLVIRGNKANRQQRAVKVISESGSFVYYHEFPYRNGLGRVDYSAEPPGPAWLRNIIGDDYFQTIRVVNFSPTDEAMKQLANLPDLYMVAIDAYQLTDEGFKQLSRAKNLEKMTISNGHKLSNRSMSTLARLPKLRGLIIQDTPIDHRSIEHLAKLANVRELYLGRTRLTVDDVTRLRVLLPDASITLDTSITVDLKSPKYQPPTGKPKPQNMPYNAYRGTSSDRRRRK